MAAHSFSPLADLVVELTDGSNKHLFLVSSEILRVVSPVWRVALDPDSKFAPLEKITVNCTEYRKTTVEGIDPLSLKYVFNILHHQAGSTPRLIAFKNLRSIAILVDQYDFASSLAPWPQFWIESLTANKTQHLEHGYEDWLFIAAIFTDVLVCKNIICDVSKQLICDLAISSSGSSASSSITFGQAGALTKDVSTKYTYRRWDKETGKGENVNLELVPEKILAFIIKERRDRLSKALLPIWTFTQNMINFSFHYPETQATVYCKNAECFALALGSLFRSINGAGLQATLMAEKFRVPASLSLQMAIAAVESLRMTTLILERLATSSQFLLDDNPTHNPGITPELYTLKKLVADLPEAIFLRDQHESTTKHIEGRFQTCPLARHLALQQQNAVTVLAQVAGYTAVSS
ncbi:hypothetical protein TWF506_008326 [Arthrobotrys conoides]|uniref:BTB domain-containing protein n=1 Tax=Arthrobotrys conoides TaxID=74498 RepID=A0AAN8NLP9_9PEZI